MATHPGPLAGLTSADWPKLFEQARATPAWREMLDRGRRSGIRYTRAETKTRTQWSIRDLVLDLRTDLVSQLEQAAVRPAIMALYADVVRIPKNLSLSLSGTALIIAARRIEVDEQAKVLLDYRSNRTARLALYTGEIVGNLTGLAVVSSSDVRQLPIVTPSTAGVWLHNSQGEPALEPRPALPQEWFQGRSPAWGMAVSAFQMAAVLTESKPDLAAGMLRFIVRCATGAPDGAAFTPEWQELARASSRLLATGEDGARTWAIDYGRLLFRGTPPGERRRKADELEQARTSKSFAVHYELVQGNAPASEPDHTRYIRHGAQPLALETLNGAEQPLRSVTLSGAEIVLDDLDRSQFIKTYGGKTDIKELAIHADTLVIKTGLQFPQTNVTIFCRTLYFEGADAWIDTTPVDDGQRSPLTLDGKDGAPGGAITLHIERFGTSESDARHFRARGGTGQTPDEGGFTPSSSVRHLRPITEKDWGELFTYANRKVAGGTVDAPSWDRYKDDKIVYAELKIGGAIVASKGEKAEPGTGGSGIVGGQPGLGGKGGTLRSAVEEVFAYADLTGGESGAALGPSKGGAGGTPTEACWLLFEDEVRSGVTALKATREIKKAVKGPSSAPGPAAVELAGAEGVCEALPAASGTVPWRTALNLGVAVQFARDALSSAHPADAREYLVPYLENADAALEADSIALSQLSRHAADLAEQALRNVDDFGNPPGWVPMLSLESAVDVYDRVLDSSMRELYTAYSLQRAWKSKADRQSALESLSRLLTDQTKETRVELAATRASIGPLIGELKQLLLEMDNSTEQLGKVEKRLQRKADDEQASKEQKEIALAVFKILGAVIKAIPLPEPYQAGAAGLGTIFDATGNFIGDGDTAFKTLKEQVQTFSTENTDSLAALANQQLKDSLDRSGEDITKLQATAAEAKRKTQALAELHGKKVRDHDALVKKERELYEMKKEALIYGRSIDDQEKLVKDAEALTKGFQSWSAKQKSELDDGTKDYLAQKAELDGQQDAIKDKQKDLATQKEELGKKKAASEKTIKEGLKKVQTLVSSVEAINKSIGRLAVPKAQLNSQWDEGLAKLKVDDPEFKTITSQLTYLNQKKMALTTKLARLQADLTAQKNEISTNLVTIHELSMQIASATEALAPQVAVYTQTLGQEAHRDLQQFLYYVVKAYEYQRVEPWGTPYHGAQQLFDDMRNVLEPSDFKYAFVDESNGEVRREQLKKLLADPAPDRDTRLTPDEFELLRVVYEKPLRDMGKQLLRRLVEASIAKEAPFAITLRAPQLQELNEKMAQRDAAQMPFDLIRLRHVDQSKERQRIANVRVTKVTCRRLGTHLPDRLTFRFTQRGKSLVRAGGKVFAFEPESGMANAGGRASSVSFETFGGNRDDGRWEVSDTLGVLQGKALWQPKPASEENLLGKLLASDKDPNAPALIKLSEFRPGALSDFVLTLDVHPPEAKIALEEVELLVTTEGSDAPADEWILCATTNVPRMIPFTISKPDGAGHSGGLGRYVGVFKGPSPIEVDVPAVFGGLTHSGWLVDGEAVNGGPTITLHKSSYLVALYAPGEAEPLS